MECIDVDLQLHKKLMTLLLWNFLKALIRLDNYEIYTTQKIERL